MANLTTLEKMDRVVLWVICAILFYSAAILLAAYVSGAHLGEWVWERHQNQFSWYSRPLFIIPAAYYAFRRKLLYIIGIMTLLASSLFWFAPPTTVSPAVQSYLEWEQQFFFANASKLPLFALTMAVAAFLFLLFFAFWQRNIWYGLAVINLGTLLKIMVSLVFGQEAGMAAIVPSLSSLLVINAIAWVLLRRSRGLEN